MSAIFFLQILAFVECFPYNSNYQGNAILKKRRGIQMIKAFLSHTSTDKDLVGKVQEILTEKNAWYDATNIENGDCIAEKINEGLREATHYVLFWSDRASRSAWVRAELNAAFVRFLSNKCKFMIFTLDTTPLPELLQPYKYDNIDKSDLTLSSNAIAKAILSQEGSTPFLSDFVNRTDEIGQIESAAREGIKLVALCGILGIGKSSLAERALQWLYSNRASKRVLLDFSSISGLAELSLELSRKSGEPFLNDNITEEDQKENIRYFIEVLSAQHHLLILKDVKKWLAEDGSFSPFLQYIVDIIVSTNMFDGITIMTSSRFINLPYCYETTIRQIKIAGLSDTHTAQVIKNNLFPGFQSNDEFNKEFAKRLFGYPLGAKIGAHRISNMGYSYFLNQPQKIKELKIGLAKELISYADISDQCKGYLKIIALAQSKLRNEEYVEAFPSLDKKVGDLADEGFVAGVLKFNDDGCYELEPLVSDYFYELAFNDTARKAICQSLEQYLLKKLQETETKAISTYLRLLPTTVHILTLNGKIDRAKDLRKELVATMEDSMWDLYNHTEYEDAKATAESILKIRPTSYDALYVKALCLTRFDEYREAEDILEQLLAKDASNSSRYHYALGRIERRKCDYKAAVEYFEMAIFSRPNYLSPYREMAQCYIHMGDLKKAQAAIEKAKEIDGDNIFVILTEALLFQKQDRAINAIELLSTQVLLDQNQAKILFRLGRAYDQLGDTDKAEEYYNEALSCDQKMYDAKLCLLSHLITENPAKAQQEIAELRPKLRGKRKAILTNIEARYIGYIQHDEQSALILLNNMNPSFRDKQWYAVKMQLLERSIDRNISSDRKKLAAVQKTELSKVEEDFKSLFGAAQYIDSDLLPDA